ncbi:hypothetical protein [Granulicoccus phenolivorans]|uniref:hypothetical protein n=1 Tax=Granulicoccus phenolivorans TaxID=266854 RepID=UPI00040763DE|nr:hypothetical protein [Granulicoccus phenolivorans]
MFTLHIEHPITDYDTWRTAFNRFADLRTRAGVLRDTVRQPTEDLRYVVVDLDFETAEQAAHLLEILRARVWADPASSPALAGTPITKILEIRGVARDAIGAYS